MPSAIRSYAIELDLSNQRPTSSPRDRLPSFRSLSTALTGNEPASDEQVIQMRAGSKPSVRATHERCSGSYTQPPHRAGSISTMGGPT